jgi:hypothetical protein
MTVDRTRLIGYDARDPGCGRCLERLARWAQLTCIGQDADRAEPRVAAHLRLCPDCRQDAEGLLSLASCPPG